MNYKFENVTFVLNIIDVLAREDEYVDIRKRKPKYTTLSLIEGAIEKAHEEEEAAKFLVDLYAELAQATNAAPNVCAALKRRMLEGVGFDSGRAQ